MRTLTILTALVLCGGLATSAWADVKAPTDKPADNGGHHWRYRYQNSHWWYYQTNNQWVGWNGQAWVSATDMAKAPDLAPAMTQTMVMQSQAPTVIYQQPTYQQPVYQQPTSNYRSFASERQDNYGRPGTPSPYPIPGTNLYQDPSLSQPVTGSGQR